MRNLLIILMLSLTTTACGPRYVDYFPCHDDGTSKPAVALLPIRDCTPSVSSDMAANEIFQVIQTDAMNHGELYFLSPEELREEAGSATKIDFYVDETQLGNTFGSADFIVIMELIEQEYSRMGERKPPLATTTICFPAEILLSIKVRLKVIDVRPRCPRVVLQEIFSQGFFMPCPDEYDSQISTKACRRFGSNLEKRLEEIIRSSY